jgi:hypothetical protein
MANLVTIAHFPDAASAQVARNVLKDAGIGAVVNSAIGLNAYYGDWMQGVQVQVDEWNAERAIQLLEAQQELEEGEDLEGEDDELPQEESEETALPPADDPAIEPNASGEIDDNPYASPASASFDTAETEDESEDKEEDIEDEARRMFRGAVISLFVPLIAPAITWLLVGRLDQYQHLSSRGKSRVVWAWIISLPITAVMVVLLLLTILAGGLRLSI